MIATDVVPTDWTRHLKGGRIGVGHDVATTEKKTSNPSAITVTEEWDGIFWERLVVRFKSADPDASMEILRGILASAPKGRLVGLGVDASNERFHAKNIQRAFRRFCRIDLIAGGETLLWQGEKYSYKTLLGQLYVSAFEDHKMALPVEEWIIKDHRLVKNHAGSFATEIDEEGNHGDTFDSGKLAHWMLLRGGRHSGRGVEAMAVGGTVKTPRSTGDRYLDLCRQQSMNRLNA